jgi:hypothetical protein
VTQPSTTRSRVVLHVGTPKSGTTFLQQALWRHRDVLLERGVTCPGNSGKEMFHAAIEVREVFDRWGLDPQEHRGTWARLCAEAREFPGTSIMSHEILAPATPEQISRAWEHLEGQEVHVVLTVRDLGRQMVSEWQERIKNGSTTSFSTFARGALRQIRSGERSGLLWGYHDVVDVLERWGSRVPAAHVHLVMAPGPGADSRELWWRFAQACGFDAADLDPTAPGRKGNQSLGQTQIALLRRVNEELDGRIKQPRYARVVKRQFAQSILATQDSQRPQTPASLVEELRAVARTWVKEVTERGYTVHGDLEQLVPPTPEGKAPSPDEVDPEEELRAAVAAIAALLVDRAKGSGGPPRHERAAPPAAPQHATSGRLQRRWWRRAAGRLRRAARRR